MNDGLGVAVGMELVTSLDQFGTELLEVVDLAVERDGDAAVSILHGLMALGDINDGKATEAHGDVVVDEIAVLVGTTVNDAVGHVLNDAAIGFGIVIDGGEANESAHESAPSLE